MGMIIVIATLSDYQRVFTLILDYASGPTSSPIMSIEEQVNNLMEVCFSLVNWSIVYHVSIFVCLNFCGAGGT